MANYSDLEISHPGDIAKDFVRDYGNANWSGD